MVRASLLAADVEREVVVIGDDDRVLVDAVDVFAGDYVGQLTIRFQ
jgi:hypothetical protein